MMFIPGLVSISFRDLSVEAIVHLCVENGLRTVEWGGDVHVPHGAIHRAREAGRLSGEYGLEIAAYGSYYRFEDILSPAEGRRPEKPQFSEVLESAAALGAPRIRVWAGDAGSRETSPENRSRIIEAARRCGDSAAGRGIELCFEYHEGTLTDTPDSARSLLEEIDHPNVFTFWQPRHYLSRRENAAALKAVLPWVRNVHIFHWGPEGFTDRRALEGCREDIRSYCRILAEGSENSRGGEGGERGEARAVLLEFVKDDSPEALRGDAAALLGVIREFE